MEIQDSQREKTLQTRRRDGTPTHIEADIEYISRRRKSTPKLFEERWSVNRKVDRIESRVCFKIIYI